MSPLFHHRFSTTFKWPKITQSVTVADCQWQKLAACLKSLTVVCSRRWFNAQWITGFILHLIICANSFKNSTTLQSFSIVYMTCVIFHDVPGLKIVLLNFMTFHWPGYTLFSSTDKNATGNSLCCCFTGSQASTKCFAHTKRSSGSLVGSNPASKQQSVNSNEAW